MEVIINADRTSIEIENEEQSIELGGTYTKQFLANDYSLLKNQPQIEGVTLKDNKTFEELGATGLTNLEIENLLNLQV